MSTIPVRAQEDIIRAGRRMDQKGWVPATAGNISVRLPPDGPDGATRIAITGSGGHKGFLDAFSIIEVDGDGRPRDPAGRPSAETALHCQIYRRFPHAGAVLHGHSVAGTVLSMAEPGDAITFEGYELFKAFAGQPTHETSLRLPLLDNDQDMRRLTTAAEPRLAEAPLGTYIRGHGAYVWAADMDRALNHLEALEFLLACELARRQLAPIRQETRHEPPDRHA